MVDSSVSDLLWQVVPLFVTVYAALIGWYVYILRRRRERRLRETAGPLDEKLQRILDLSKELSALNTEVRSEFDLQMAATEQAKRDAENAAALAALSEEQREAAARLVKAQIGEAFDKNTKTERWFQVALSLASFVAGVIATLILT
ncbi:hypothetical protein [Demequina zhanjiangensis]|uniref:Uncharacterized protein n=1 Tax=Demequina zhanjiangensis TaxID=3051659 RepID=A0ABT8G3R9_9MICO|nr:hypothetical protein [Demequina sp. SYSU T00b26]MDN4473574.1 hypothetical protein [Demequina sp. SYSU T00b26]